jgi:hypothetical protein
MDAPQPELTMEWYHEGYQVIRIFVQDPLDMTTRERLMAKVMTFRDVPDLASLRREVDAISLALGLRASFTDKPDYTNPFGDWVTLGFRRT